MQLQTAFCGTACQRRRVSLYNEYNVAAIYTNGSSGAISKELAIDMHGPMDTNTDTKRSAHSYNNT